MTLTEPRGYICDLQWHTLGEVRVDDGECGNVVVEYLDMPARFWRFTITSDDGYAIVLETGSGSLTEYLPIAEQFAAGMLRHSEAVPA